MNSVHVQLTIIYVLSRIPLLRVIFVCFRAGCAVDLVAMDTCIVSSLHQQEQVMATEIQIHVPEFMNHSQFSLAF
jgi:hypothetical protein